jgi:hypothetical protein
MGGIKLVSRVAFICNICFVLAIILQRTGTHWEGEIVSLIIIMGYVLAVILNVVAALWYLWMRVFGKSSGDRVPHWLILVNFLFLIIQLIVFLK